MTVAWQQRRGITCSEAVTAVRTELAEHAPPHAVDATLAACRAEGFRMVAAERGVEFVERAQRGEVFRPSL